MVLERCLPRRPVSRPDDGQHDGMDRASASDWHHVGHDDSDMPYEAAQG